MKRRLYAPIVILIGLLSAEIVATAHVYLSNLDLLQATDTVLRNGYLAVPNATVADGLTSLTTAMAGGLFFTLSIGAGLSLTTLVAVWLWDRAFRRRLKASCLGLLVWLLALVLINGSGWNLVASVYIVVVPLVTAIAAIVLLPGRTTLISPGGVVWPVAAAVILALLWSLVADKDLFANIRDHLLLANPTGRAITAAYYDYTLYPAEAFKSLSQKQIRTCVLDGGLKGTDLARMERVVRTRDYLPVTAGVPADLTITAKGDPADLALANGNDTVLTVSKTDFLDTPDKILGRFSDELDHNRVFRTLTLACLLLGFPLVLFTFLFSAICLLPDLLVTMAVSDVLAAALCIAVGVSLLAPVYRGHNAMAAPVDPVADLSSASAATRIAALRSAVETHRDITRSALDLQLGKSRDVAERYWLARSLAYARHPEAQSLLNTLAEDPVSIVACQALWAMGKRNNRHMVPWIVERINASSHWYFQMYAYRTLRTLGWVQPRRNQFASR